MFHSGIMAPATTLGGVAEWFKATVLKTVDCNRSMSSNPIASAILHTAEPVLDGLCRFWDSNIQALRYYRFRIASASFRNMLTG